MSELELNSVLKYTNNDIESAIRAMEALSLNTSPNDNDFIDRRVNQGGVDESHHQSVNSVN